jgi:sugar O-acyltransferase (sialic acid O-acetyltransferase NeuD family)
MTRIVIVGAGGHGAIVADMLPDALGFVDDSVEKEGATILGLRVLGPIASLATIEHDAIVVAIGDNGARHLLTDRLIASGERLATAIHPSASIARSASVGDGAMISAGAVIQPRAVIGRGVIVNTKAAVDHDSVVGDFGHVSAGATVGANVRIGEESLVAIGASIVSGRRVGARSIVGAGAVVIRDVPDDVTVLGIPARITSDRRSAAPSR